MRKAQHNKKSTEEERKEWRVTRHLFSASLASGVATIALSLLATFLSSYVLESKSKGPDILSISHNVWYFSGGIVLLGIIIVGIAGLIARKNRDVILLKQNLAEIYLLALRKSALNPQIKSTTSNE